MLDFLSTVTILDVAEKTTGRTGGPRKQRNPEGLAIRVFRTGEVFPSLELIQKFNLEYTNKGTEAGTMGFDVIDTDLYPSFNVGAGVRMLIISPVSKTLPKVDLFGRVDWDEAGKPKSSVVDQGSKTFGMDCLIPSIEEVYELKFARSAVTAKPATATTPAVEAQDAVEGLEFVDMLLVANPTTDEPWAGKTVTFVPKSVSRGKDKGSVTTQRRENPQFYAFLPASMVTPAAKPQAATELQTSAQTEEEDEGILTDMSQMAPVKM